VVYETLRKKERKKERKRLWWGGLVGSCPLGTEAVSV
jgi:hypothetical protein